jgi:hypothetical protein
MTPEPVILLGDKVRFSGETSYWRWEGQEFYIPRGTEGRIVAWLGSKACAIRIPSMKHPGFQDWPMTQTFPGKSPIPWGLQLLERQHHEDREMPRGPMYEPEATGESDVPGVLGPGPRRSAAPGHGGKPKGAPQPGPHRGLQAGGQRSTGAPGNRNGA